MAYKKKSPLNAMERLIEQIGDSNILALISGESFLMQDSNSSTPYQVIIDHLGRTIYDSRKDGSLSYEPFEEIKVKPIEKQGFQSFYQLRKTHIQAYKKLRYSK